MYQRRTPIKARGPDPSGKMGGGRNDPPVLKRKNSKTRLFQKRERKPIKLIKNKLGQIVNDFCHARTGAQGCFVAGVIRCTYAMLYLYSIILLTIQMPTLFDPHKGLLPYFITGEIVGDYDYSIFEFFPQSSLVVYGMFLLGLTSGFLLLLGIQPRKGAIGAYFFLYNLQFQNKGMLFDHEFCMNKMWAFFLILLPLDHFTVYDDFGGIASVIRRRLNLPFQQQQQQRSNQSTSWPMWPFRLWQVYTCMVYIGSGFCKLNSQVWRDGNALSWLWYDETVGRLYPAFVVEFLFNRLIVIKLQTWLSLLVENLCFITIWPLKTRKITFMAIVLLHIGIELSLVMHIFEYLSVLGWVCFFVYPDDGNSNSDDLIKNKTDDEDKWRAVTAFRSKKGKIIEITVAVSLLYLLIFDIFPANEAEELLPGPLAYLVYLFVAPPAFVDSKLDALNHYIGISSNPYILFKGIPWKAQTRMTAVIRFSDGKDPILHQDNDWGTSSFFRREIDYWYATYTYYLYQKPRDPYIVPYYAALSVFLAEKYGKGSIDRHYNEVIINPDNEVESVSIQTHRREGSDLPAPEDWSLFSSIPREWSYESECKFVFTPQTVQLEDQQFTMPMNQLWELPGDDGNHMNHINGCINYNRADKHLHREGKYGENDDEVKNDDDDNGDNEDEEDTDRVQGARDEEPSEEDNGDDTPPVDQEDDGEGDGDGEDEDPVVRLIEENEDGREQFGLPKYEDENESEEENRNGGDDDGNLPGGPNGNEGDAGPNDGEDNENGDQENGGSNDDRENHRSLRLRSGK